MFESGCQFYRPASSHSQAKRLQVRMSDSIEQNNQPISWWAYPILVVLGLIAFWPSVWFDFVNWDDPAYITHNELIQSWSPSNLYGIGTEFVTRNYGPLTVFSFLLDHSLWGMNPCGFHATNVLLHLMNGILVLLLVRQLTDSRFVAFVSAALFLVHPVQIETVAWISSRKGLLSALFILAALIVRLKPDADSRSDLRYMLLLSAALLSKALAVVAPPIVLLYDLLIRRRKFSEAFVAQIIPGLMALLLLIKTMSAQGSVTGGIRGHFDLSLLQILAVDSTILWRYVTMLVWPSDLCVLYNPATSGIQWLVAGTAASWSILGITLWKLRKRCPMALWSAACVMLLLLPVLNLFPITTLMNDRYLYLPCIIVFATAATWLQRLLNLQSGGIPDLIRWSVGGLKWSVSMAAVAGALVVTTEQLPVWRNSDSLWNHAMQNVPELSVVRIQLALTKYDSGQRREAIRVLQTALIQCEPDDLDRKRMHEHIRQWSEELTTRTAAAETTTSR